MKFLLGMGRPFRAGEKYDVYFRSQAWYQVNSQYRYGPAQQR